MSKTTRGGPTPDAPSYGVTWGGLPQFAQRGLTLAVSTFVVAGLAGPAVANAATVPSSDPVGVIVREAQGSGDAPERAVFALGGTYGRPLDIINGFSATVPGDKLDALRAVPGVQSVTEDASVQLHMVNPMSGLLDPVTDTTSSTLDATTSTVDSTTSTTTDTVTDTTATADSTVTDTTTTVTDPAPTDTTTTDTTTTDTTTTDPATTDPTPVDTGVAGVSDQAGSMFRITHDVTHASSLWAQGIDGQGVDVAVLDSGVVPVDGLRAPGKVVYGPDLSMDAQVCDDSGANCEAGPAQNFDGFGHGTHMAGIVGGLDDGATAADYNNPDVFTGMAPGARIVSVKVADGSGSTDVSQAIAGIDWVVSHKNSDGLNIRVMNLSFGTDGVQSYMLDPLTYAVEQAWKSGIVVVVAAGNGGYGTAKLNNPAYDPFVLAVGGADSRGTYDVQDDVVPSWSSTGDGKRNPDIVAPGAYVVSLRSPGSYLDTEYPTARQVGRLFRGSGTSQSAAVVSGSVAMLLQQRPELTPDQVKALLIQTAQPLPDADPIAQGNGELDLDLAASTPAPSVEDARQIWASSTGDGSLDAARGTAHVDVDGVELTGETDILGNAWVPDTASASGSSWNGGAFSSLVDTVNGLLGGSDLLGWDGGAWLGRDWYGHTVNASMWAGQVWDGVEWIGQPWVGSDADTALQGKTWSGKTWSGKTWSGKTWSGKTWSGKTWSGKTWSGKTWSGVSWGG